MKLLVAVPAQHGLKCLNDLQKKENITSRKREGKEGVGERKRRRRGKVGGGKERRMQRTKKRVSRL